MEVEVVEGAPEPETGELKPALGNNATLAEYKEAVTAEGERVAGGELMLPDGQAGAGEITGAAIGAVGGFIAGGESPPRPQIVQKKITGQQALSIKNLVEGNFAEVSDGYHTFGELYQHRHLLFISFLLFTDFPRSYSIDPNTPGWIIVRTHLLAGQVSYHLPATFIPLIKDFVPLDDGPEFDGHTSLDVLQRLEENINYWKTRVRSSQRGE